MDGQDGGDRQNQDFLDLRIIRIGVTHLKPYARHSGKRQSPEVAA